jgi:hypothetical protein
MYSLVKRTTLKQLALIETPTFVIAILIAEFLYKFGSFILECFAFLVTWFVFSWILHELNLLKGKTGSRYH